MPRLPRIDFDGAIHYVLIRGCLGRSILFEPGILNGRSADAVRTPDRLRYFEGLIADAYEECGSEVHAFAWAPNDGVLVIQTHAVPLHSVMARVCGRYSRYLHRKGHLAREERAFDGRYSSKLVSPAYLGHAIRRAERMPVELGLCRQPLDYPFSSARCLGPARPAWLMAYARIRGRVGAGKSNGARELGMLDTDTDVVATLFQRGAQSDPRVIGDRAFVKSAMSQAAAGRSSVPNQEQIVNAVGRLLQRAALGATECSLQVLKKALVARHAVRSGAATLTRVAEWYSVTPAALRGDINRYRALAPALFNASLDELFDPYYLHGGIVLKASGE
jgi:REP element-mobilizing transposase RayT